MSDRPENSESPEEKGKGNGHHKRASAAALVDAFAKQYEADRKETARREGHRIFREWLTIIGLFLAAGVAYFQWSELHSTDTTLRSTLLAQIKSSQLQLRAYIGLEPKALELHCGSCDQNSPRPERTTNGFYKDDYIVISIRNSGQTPANDLSISGNWKEMPCGKALPDDFNYPNTDKDGVDCKGVINPGDIVPAGQILAQDKIAMVKRARDHKSTIYFYGEIKYRDIFGKERTSPYCRVYDPDVATPFSFGDCPKHTTPAPDD